MHFKSFKIFEMTNIKRSARGANTRTLHRHALKNTSEYIPKALLAQSAFTTQPTNRQKAIPLIGKI